MRLPLLLLPLALAAAAARCLEPFYGNPGPAAAKLAMPPAPVLMVPTPALPGLAPKAADLFAHDLTAALVNEDVPSIAGPAAKGVWRLGIEARAKAA